MSQPFVCPVCFGKGIVPNGFYLTPGQNWCTSSIVPEICRSCGGRGIVWGTEYDALKELEKIGQENSKNK